MKGSTTRKLHQIPPGHLLVGIDPHKKEACGSYYDALGHGRLKVQGRQFAGRVHPPVPAGRPGGGSSGISRCHVSH